MKTKNYGINSLADAFLALNDILDEEIKVTNLKERSKLKEAASVDLNNVDDIEKAQEFRKNDEKTEDNELEVIDVDADSLNELKDSGSYIGKILLQCNSCKATKFVDVDKLERNENDPELYNTEDECPHCHNTGTGYALIGQVGKKEEAPKDDATLNNDTVSDEQAMFDNTNDVEPQAEETPTEETANNENKEENTDEASYNETNTSDDTDELDLPELGDEFDVDDVEEDDTEEKDTEEDKKKEKKESLQEEVEEEDEIAPEAYGDELINDFETRHPWNDDLDEKLDMSTFEGSIANLIDTFTIEDNPVNIKLLNKNGSELGMYGSDDLPFNVKSQMMDTFNTDDNYLEVNVTENGDGTTVNDLFNYYRPDEDNQTTFIVTNVDTDEEEDFEELSEFLETYGDYYIDGALGLRTLNIYIADGDLETEVEPLDDEEIEELGKENAEKEESEVTEESLIEEIIKSYPGLKLNRINNSLSEEYFIADSIRLNEDIDLVYKNFVKPTNNEKLIEHFKSYTGYEDEVDKFLREHNISKDKYNTMLNESADKIYTIGNKSYVLYKDSYGNYKLDDKESRNRVADWDSYDEAVKDIKKWINAGKIIDPTDEVNEKLLTSVKTRAELGETINKLVEAKEKYRISKSLTEGYRYDIFVNEDYYDDDEDDEAYDPSFEEYAEEQLSNYARCKENWMDPSEAGKGHMNHGECDIMWVTQDAFTYTDFETLMKCFGEYYKEETNGKTYTVVMKCRSYPGYGNYIKRVVSFKDGNYYIEDEEPQVLYDGDLDLYIRDGEFFLDCQSEDITGYGKTIGEVKQSIIDELEDLNRFAETTDGYEVSDNEVKLDGNFPDEMTVNDYLQSVGKTEVSEDEPIGHGRYYTYEVLAESLKEDLNDKDEVEVLDDGKAEAVATELVDQTPTTNVEEPVETTDIVPDESLRTFDEDYNTEDKLAELKKIKKERKLTDDEAEELAYCENEVDSRHAEQNYLNGIKEEIELNDENTSDEDCEMRLGELLYLQDQRELTDDEKEELAYCENRVAEKMAEEETKNESNEIDLEEFDNCINEYLEDNEDDLLAYKSSNVEKIDEQLIINGLLESNNGNKQIQFTLTKVLNEDTNETNKYIVKNNLNDTEFNLEM